MAAGRGQSLEAPKLTKKKRPGIGYHNKYLGLPKGGVFLTEKLMLKVPTRIGKKKKKGRRQFFPIEKVNGRTLPKQNCQNGEKKRSVKQRRG